MKTAGRIKTWHADKGYGFIDVHADAKDIFVHVTALQDRAAAPREGDRVMFDLAQGKDGRLEAVNVAVLGAAAKRDRAHAASPLALLFAVLAQAAIVAAALTGTIPRPVGAVSFVLSLVSFITYAHDKARAGRRAWRVPETNLHLLALCGGWPGALVAQQLLRHKNRKPAFQVTFWATVVLNVGAIVLWKRLSGLA
jgi:uncharacterized membrane protein YsdA (DUF1294 family)/cold shock CspA family protein